MENQKASFYLFFLKPCKLFQTVTFVFRNNNKKQLHKKINNTKILENQAIVLHLSLKKIYLEFNFLLLYLLMLKTLTIAWMSRVTISKKSSQWLLKVMFRNYGRSF